MKLIDRIKKAIYEEDEEFEEQQIVKKIDVEKTVNEVPIERKMPTFVEEEQEEIKVMPKKPIIFDDEDFEVEEKPTYRQHKEYNEYKEPVKAEEKKPLYGGYGIREERTKDKFKPSPVLSPVYGIMEKKDLEKQERPTKSLETLFKEEKKPVVSFDTIRQKAYGEIIEEKEEDEKGLFFEMQDTVPGIDKVTLGDAEEYYQDLGLEYNIDYKDADKEKMTRSRKNKELSEIVDEEIKEDFLIQEEIKQKTKKTKKEDKEEIEEKNLYDLIDMMYDSKE